MGKIVKAALVIGIAALLIIFLVVGVQATKSMDNKLSNLETQVNLIDKKKEALIEKTLSLEEVKNNLTVMIAMEKDKAIQLELQKNLTALKAAAEQARSTELQKLAEARAQAVEQARQLQLQQQQAQAASATTTKTVRRTTSSSTPSGAATATPAPAPAPAPAPKPAPPSPPKVTSAS